MLYNRVSYSSLPTSLAFQHTVARQTSHHLRFFMRWLAAAKKTLRTFLAAAGMTCTAFLAMRLQMSSNRPINLPRRVSHGMRPVTGLRSSSSLCSPMASATAMEGMLVLMVSVGRVSASGDNGKSLVLRCLGFERSRLQVFCGFWGGFGWDRSGGDGKSVVVLDGLQEAESQAFVAVIEVVSRKTQ